MVLLSDWHVKLDSLLYEEYTKFFQSLKYDQGRRVQT